MDNEKILETFDNALFKGTSKEYEEFTNTIYGCIKEIKNSNSIRHIVLETWLIIDYFLQDAVGKAFNMNELSTKEHDWRTIVLPRSFRDRLNIFEQLLESQKNLPTDPYEYVIKLPAQFWRSLRKDQQLFNKFEELEHSYYEKYHPEIIEQKEKEEQNKKNLLPISLSNSPETIQYQTNKQWYDFYKNIDDNWFKEANHINKARNKAAHSYNSADIYKELGLTGEKAFEQSKKKCLGIINNLIGVITNEQL